MITINKKWLSLLAGCAFAFQSAVVSANVIADYQLEFSEVDIVPLGESFDVDVYIDIPPGLEITSFGFDFVNPFSLLSFDGFEVANWIEADDLFNQVGGAFGFFGPDGDNTYIATLHFTGLSKGIENISTFGEVSFYDFMANETYVSSIGGSFNVQVPEPSIFAIFLIGVCGLTMSRKTQKS